jgi:hypothetical protein
VSKYVMDFIVEQIHCAEDELNNYPPTKIDWKKRTLRTAERLVPWLIKIASPLSEYVSGVMNSPIDVRALVEDLIKKNESHRDFSEDPATRNLIKSLRSSLDLEQFLISGAGGTVVSKLIETYLIRESTDWILESNGSSDYPDLFFRNDAYDELPIFKRGAKQIYGAALKGKARRPVRIPDGLEIKTCKTNFAVDSHHAHVGLHLVLLFERLRNRFTVKGIYVGFLRHSLYRITVPATLTTTLKASFNGEHFVSLFPQK